MDNAVKESDNKEDFKPFPKIIDWVTFRRRGPKPPKPAKNPKTSSSKVAPALESEPEAAQAASADASESASASTHPVASSAEASGLVSALAALDHPEPMSQAEPESAAAPSATLAAEAPAPTNPEVAEEAPTADCKPTATPGATVASEGLEQASAPTSAPSDAAAALDAKGFYPPVSLAAPEHREGTPSTEAESAAAPSAILTAEASELASTPTDPATPLSLGVGGTLTTTDAPVDPEASEPTKVLASDSV